MEDLSPVFGNRTEQSAYVGDYDGVLKEIVPFLVTPLYSGQENLLDVKLEGFLFLPQLETHLQSTPLLALEISFCSNLRAT